MAFNIVEVLAAGDGDDSGFDQPCAFGYRVEDHAVYCHNDAWKAGPRKCYRTWYGGDLRDTDCPGFSPNPNPNAAAETISDEDAMATLYDSAVKEDAFISNLAPAKRAEYTAYTRGEGGVAYPHTPEDYLVPPPERSREEKALDVALATALMSSVRWVPIPFPESTSPDHPDSKGLTTP